MMIEQLLETRRDLKGDIADLRSTQRLHSWMLSTTVALLLVILFKVFSK